ncbi:MAG: hypothetical protein E6R03_10690 [Hyphomicrobiaceae bacterium]|nr:MAG: hypothetical protein E6R03_10690 [Hyphomicrobiaceae bacterium]
MIGLGLRQTRRLEEVIRPLGREFVATENATTPDKVALQGVTVPVVVSDIVIQTDPKSVNTLHVTLVFIRYNSMAFGMAGLQFLDKNGDPTPDIGQCPWIDRLASLIYLNPNGAVGHMKEFAPLPEGTDLSMSWTPTYGDPTKDLKTFPDARRTLGEMVVESVNVSMNFAVVPIPVLGSKYPTVQIMGSPSIQASISLATTSSQVVRSFHAMKDELDETARKGGGSGRNEKILIENSVLNLVGAKHFIITAASTAPYPNSTNAYLIQMSLAEAEYGLDRQQQLLIAESGVKEENIREFWNYLWTKWDKFISNSEPVPMVPGEVFTLRSLGASGVDSLALYTIFGDGSGRTGRGRFMSADIFTAGLVEYARTELGIEPEDLKSVPKTLYKAIVDNSSYLFTNGYFGRGVDSNQESLESHANGVVMKAMNRGSFYGSVGSMIMYMTSKRLGNFGISKDLWDAMLEVILRPPQSAPRGILNNQPIYDIKILTAARESLYSMFVSGDVGVFGEDFPLIKRLFEESPKNTIVSTEQGQIQRTLLSNYPDLRFPTYGEVFADSKGALLRANDGSPLWQKFAPTYSDLGVLPVASDTDVLRPLAAVGEVARGVNDPVEPAFWIYTKKVKDKLYDGLQETTERVNPANRVEYEKLAKLDETQVLSVNVNTEEIRAIYSAADADKIIAETVSDIITARANNRGEPGSKSAQDIVSGRFKRFYEVIDSTGRLATIIEPSYENRGAKFKIKVIPAGPPIYVNHTLGIAYDKNRGDRTKALMEDIVHKTKDNRFSPCRHYPAMRIYFVEFDDNISRDSVVRQPTGSKIRLLDDLYTTNAVLSVKVTHHKRDASTAVIEVLNTKGTFDTDEFLTETEAKSRRVQPDDTNEDMLKKLKLKYGTGIQIRMGYSAKPDELDVVFTGQIVELNVGPIVTLVAQSYKTELFQEFSMYNGNANARRAMNDILTKMPLPHFGRVYDTRDVSDEEFRRFAGQSGLDQSSGFFGVTGQRGVLANWFGSRVSTASRNIWFESRFDQHSTVGEAFRDIGESLPFGLDSADHYWLFDRINVWDAFEEIARHHPGHIADVRPFNTESTLFFGLPDQVYQYRDRTFKETVLYNKYLKVSKPALLNEIGSQLIGGFLASPFGTTAAQARIQYADFLAKFGSGSWRGNDPQVGRMLGFLPGIKLTGVEEALKQLNPVGVWPSYRTYNIAKNNTGTTTDTGAPYNFEPLTASLDFTGDWKTIESFGGLDLLRYLTAYHFGLSFDNWNVLEGMWHTKFLEGMQPLANVESSTLASNFMNDSSIRTQAGNNLYAALIGNASGLTGISLDSIASNEVTAFEKLSGPDLDRYRDLVEQRRRTRNNPNLSRNLLADIEAELSDLDAKYGLNRIQSEAVRPSIGQGLWDNWLSYRVFLHYFANYIAKGGISADKGKADLLKRQLAAVGQYRIPPGFKVFRNYHYVTDRSDIISNDIEATTREMANTVMLKCPTEDVSFGDSPEGVTDGSSHEVISSNQTWVYYPNERGLSFHPNIDASSRILRATEEPNANRREAQASCLVSNMALGIRPMYRGQLKMLGRDIWPWDVVYLADGFNSMYGPVEVDRVVHEFTRETGWVTTIEPHAFVSVNSPSDKYQANAMFDVLSAVSTVLDIATVVGIGLLIASGVGAGVGLAGAAARAGAKEVLSQGIFRGAFSVAKNVVTGVAKAGISARGIMPTLWTIGKIGTLYGVNSSIVTPLHNLFNNIVFKMNFEGELWPVDVLPLTYKGVPYYSGIPLSDREVFTFWQGVKGTLGDTWREIQSLFASADNDGYFIVDSARDK